MCLFAGRGEADKDLGVPRAEALGKHHGIWQVASQTLRDACSPSLLHSHMTIVCSVKETCVCPPRPGSGISTAQRSISSLGGNRAQDRLSQLGGGTRAPAHLHRGHLSCPRRHTPTHTLALRPSVASAASLRSCGNRPLRSQLGVAGAWLPSELSDRAEGVSTP